MIVLRRSEERDVPLIADASDDPETRKWLDDEPLTAERQRDLVSRARERWRSGRAAPFVIAEATTDVALGLVNVQFDDEEVAGVAVSVFPRRAADEWVREPFGLPESGRCSSSDSSGSMRRRQPRTLRRSARSRERVSSERVSCVLTARRMGGDTTASCSRSLRAISLTASPLG